jgi:GrpB-like predicted nucleotidyltransferase (UPF0157 family)
MPSNQDEAVVVVEYDAKRKSIFAGEKKLLSEIFSGTNAPIEHVGSTSVDGLGGKPIIDMMIGLGSMTEAEERMEQLAAHHYLYMPQYETEFPDRRFFRKPETGPRECHLHCALLDSDFYRDHIDFRDYLINNPEAAQEYFLLKQKLASQLGADRNAYTDAKTDFIERSLELARQQQSH